MIIPMDEGDRGEALFTASAHPTWSARRGLLQRRQEAGGDVAQL